MMGVTHLRDYLDLESVSALRRVDKKMKGMVDAIFVNPHSWAVLHRMSSHSFERFLSSMGLQNPGRVRPRFEDTRSKYDPSKYGTSPKHDWPSNYEWLEDIKGRFSQVALTDLPLSPENVIRQSKSVFGAKKDDFSAYAREIAYLFLNKFAPSETPPPRRGLQTKYMTKQDPVLSVEQQTTLTNILANRKEAVELSQALVTFDSLGLPVKESDLEKAKKRVAELGDKNAELLNKVKEYIKQKRPSKDDPTQWPGTYLEDLLRTVHNRPVSRREQGQWRQTFKGWYDAKKL
ncbi:MAG TPA: hypothetical protein VG148_08280 [Pyrinomonadaceae bacterium]|nr:hypothetical protein [Pyrinomonadaceae bacterium]